jgi:hypothetical protein
VPRSCERERMDEHDDDDELFRMVNLYPSRTGLPMTIWAGPRGYAQHAPRIKVCMAHGNKMDMRNTAVVGVLPKPRLIAGSLSARDRDAVFAWITLNTEALLAHWRGDIDGIEMGVRSKPVVP